MCPILLTIYLFFFNNPATTEIYTLSLHDALPILRLQRLPPGSVVKIVNENGIGIAHSADGLDWIGRDLDRKSTRLNSSHRCISYAVFCLKKKKKYALENADTRES